jgi:hypothetical protein
VNGRNRARCPLPIIGNTEYQAAEHDGYRRRRSIADAASERDEGDADADGSYECRIPKQQERRQQRQTRSVCRAAKPENHEAAQRYHQSIATARVPPPHGPRGAIKIAGHERAF